MRIRPLTRDDIPSVATLNSEALWEDDLYSCFYPYKEQYPEDFRTTFVRLYKLSLSQPDCQVLVAEIDETDADWQGRSELVGCAIWKRRGRAKGAKAWVPQDSLFHRIERGLLSLEASYISLFGINQSTSRSLMRLFNVPNEVFKDIGDYWHLALLCVPPKHQRRGIGSRLLDWGLDQATREDVPAALNTSPVAEALYLRKGFRQYGYSEHAPGFVSPALLWEPEGQKGKWGVSRTIDTFRASDQYNRLVNRTSD